MLKGISWIFFDVGSTLVDESVAHEHRIMKTISGTDVTYPQFYEAMIDFYKKNKKGDTEAIKLFGLKKADWLKEEETPYPEAADCLKRLGAKYKIGIIANQSLGCERRLEKMGLMGYIDLVVASAEEKVEKPDPRIFRLALDRAGCLAEHAAMVGDRLVNDVAPAKQLGMKTIWIRQGFGGLSTPTRKEETPDYAVDTLNEICRLFAV